MGLLWIGRTDMDEGRDEQTSRETIERYRLEMSAVTDGKKEIRQALPALAPYAPHATELGLFVSSFLPSRQKEGCNIWDLEVTYSTDVAVPKNPLLEPAVITLDTEVRDVASLFDKDGKPYMTTAGELIEGTNEEADLVFQVGKAISIKWPSWLLDYGGAVSSDDIEIKGLPCIAGTLKCLKLKIGADQQTEAPGAVIDWAQLDMELHYRASGWRTLTPNRGFHQLVPIDPNAKPTQPRAGKLAAGTIQVGSGKKFNYVKILVKGENGSMEEPAEPQMLDANGALIANPNPNNIVILEFKRNDELPFNNLPLK